MRKAPPSPACVRCCLPDLCKNGSNKSGPLGVEVEIGGARLGVRAAGLDIRDLSGQLRIQSTSGTVINTLELATFLHSVGALE